MVFVKHISLYFHLNVNAAQLIWKTRHSSQLWQRSIRYSELFKLKFLLKLFFKSPKIILIINFFYILSIFIFFSCKEGKKQQRQKNSDCQDNTICHQLGRHLCNLHRDINILVWGLLLSEQILHCHKYHTLKPRYSINDFIIKIWLLFQNH